MVKKVLRSVVKALLGTVFLFLLLEAGLLLFGYGHPTGFLIKEKEQLRSNPAYGLQWFPAGQARAPLGFSVAADKPEDLYRIVILGGSAIQGDPEPTFGVHRYLETMLQSQYPGKKFEVINLAMTAINSHTVLDIARETSALQADAAVLYLGHNEVVGPYGLANRGEVLPANSVRRIQRLKKTRTGQLLSALAGKLSSSGRGNVERWAGMQLFLDRQIPADHPGLTTTYNNFEQNVRDAILLLRAQGTKVVLCTPEPDYTLPPFASTEVSNDWKNQQDAARTLFMRGQTREAFEAYSKLVAEAPGNAEIHFEMAQVHQRMGRQDEAAAERQKALNLDTLRFRADEEIIARVRKLFGEADAYLNSDKLFAGEPAFLDHVHFTQKGTVLLAEKLAYLVSPWLKDLGYPEPAAPEGKPDWQAKVGYTPWDLVSIHYEMIKRLSHPPFENLPGMNVRISRLVDGMKWASQQIKSGSKFRVEAQYRARLELAPGDDAIRIRLAGFLRNQDELDDAWKEISLVLEHQPYHTDALYEAGRIEILRGHVDEAIALFEKAAGPNPFAATEALLEAGTSLAEAGRRAEAIDLFGRAVKSSPNDPIAHYNLGLALAQEGEKDAARKHLERSLELDPQQPEVEKLLESATRL